MDVLDRSTLVDQVFNYIKKYMLDNNLQEGDQLPTENFLGEKLNVSRTTVRSALNMLRCLGFIKIYAGKGAFVDNLGGNPQYNHLLWFVENKVRLTEIMEARMAVEPYAVLLAIQRAQDTDMDKLKQLNDQFRHSPDIATLVRKDAEFHKEIVELSENQVFVYMFKYMMPSLYDVFERVFTVQGISKVPLSSHEELTLAIVKRDTKKASELMEAHLLNSMKTIRSIEQSAWGISEKM